MDAPLLARAMAIPLARSTKWLLPLHAAFQYAEIDTRERMAAFLAQIGHESMGLHYTREIWGPTGAQARYEGRRDLGNTQPGDGKRYMGRGLIQTTGRSNYARVARNLAALGAPDFEAAPEALELPKWAALSAADYWRDHDLNKFCSPGKVRFNALTRAVNGGTNGLADRLIRYERAYAALSK